MGKKIHRWQPTRYTPCGRKIQPGLRFNIGYFLSEGVTCIACENATSLCSVSGDKWNGQSFGYPKADNGEEIEVDLELETNR